MIELVYIGEEIPAEAPAFVRPFHHKETEMQLTWEDVRQLMAITSMTIRPATAEEMDAAWKNLNLIKACSAYLSQFVEPAAQEGA